MDVYRRSLYKSLIYDILRDIPRLDTVEAEPCSAGLHKLTRAILYRNGMTFNYNAEGRLHSRYLGDRYEPAIILHSSNYTRYYYLFDGEIKDCIHPFSVRVQLERKRIIYYSSERIKQRLPIRIHIDRLVTEIYNHDFEPILAGYKYGKIKIELAKYAEQDYTLHSCMEPIPQFKFAD